MALSQDTTSALYGAYRLARADAGGMAYFDTDKIGGVQIELEQLPPHLDDDPYWSLKPWLQSAPQTG